MVFLLCSCTHIHNWYIILINWSLATLFCPGFKPFFAFSIHVEKIAFDAMWPWTAVEFGTFLQGNYSTIKIRKMQKIRFAAEVFGMMLILLMAVLIQCTYQQEVKPVRKMNNSNSNSGTSVVKRSTTNSKSSTGLLKLISVSGPVQKVYFWF